MNETKKIICNREPFDEECVPEKIRYRDSQMKELWSCLFITPRGSRPSHVFLFGPSGTGKTMLVQSLMMELKNRSILSAYVNCWQYQSLHSIMDKIIGDFRLITAERNNTMFKMERFEKFLNKKPFFLILDDIDKLDPREIDFILYNLCDVKNATLICIGYNLRFLKRLDDRVRSRLVPKIIEFPAYSRKELSEILRERVERGLSEGTWDENVLRKTTAMANGDARMAIQTIKNAAECAENGRKEKIEIKDLNKSCVNARELKINKVLDNLNDHHRIIFEVIRKNRRMVSGKLWDAYKKECEKRKAKHAPQRTFQYYRDELLNMGLICSKRMRIRGNVRLYSVNPKPI
jgi:archaeal cell division control protein 6